MSKQVMYERARERFQTKSEMINRDTCNRNTLMLQNLQSFAHVEHRQLFFSVLCCLLCMSKLFLSTEDVASNQHVIDSIDDQLRQLALKKAELQIRLDNILNANHKKDEKGGFEIHRRKILLNHHTLFL